MKAKKSGYTPLVIACLKGNVNGIKKLLDYNASIEAFDKKDGVTPLIATIIENKLEATEYLISRGANIMGRRGGKGITPLMNAIGLQRTSIRNLILAHGLFFLHFFPSPPFPSLLPSPFLLTLLLFSFNTIKYNK